MSQSHAAQPTDQTMYQLVAATAAQQPRHTAYLFQGKRVTYAQFLSRIDAAARGLYAMGIRRGHRVSICLPNCPQALICLYALNRIGAVASMIHPRSTAADILFSLNTSRSKAILTLSPLFSTIQSILPRLHQPCRILLTNISDALPVFQKAFYCLTHPGHCSPPAADSIPWQRIMQTRAPLPDIQGNAHHPAVILYSGGTTGTPKAVVLSNGNFNALALQTLAVSGFPSVAGMRMLSLMPIFHGFGLGIGIHTALVGGAACVLMPRFSPDAFQKVLLRQKPQILPGVPTLLEALLRCKGLQKADLSFIRGIFCGGDRLTPQLKARVRGFLAAHNCSAPVREGYGATECVAAACLTPLGTSPPDSVGLPLPHTAFQIVQPGTQISVPIGQSGEICISGPTVMLGYLDHPEETHAALQRHADGKYWLHTGDLGYLDPSGCICFQQRIKRIIVSSGYNIYPSQLEAALNAHPKVQLSCCIGIPDTYRGQKVRAYVVPAAHQEPSQAFAQALIAHCRQSITDYALPREIVFRSSLPMTAVGKVAYHILQAEAARETSS